MKKIIASMVIALSLVGCANVKHSAQASVAADAATTIVGVSAGLSEANPLITSPAGLAASVALRWIVINELDKLPEPERTQGLAAVGSLTWGFAASNLAILATSSNPAGAVAGIVAAILHWVSTEDARNQASGVSK